MRPVRELIKQERLKDQERKKKEAAKNSNEALSLNNEVREEKIVTLRPLNMEDMRQAKNQVAASFAANGSIMSELKQWNELYGDGDPRKKEQLMSELKQWTELYGEGGLRKKEQLTLKQSSRVQIMELSFSNVLFVNYLSLRNRLIEGRFRGAFLSNKRATRRIIKAAFEEAAEERETRRVGAAGIQLNVVRIGLLRPASLKAISYLPYQRHSV